MPARGVVSIDDPADPRLDGFRSLKDPTRQRATTEQGVFVVEGYLAVAALLGSRYEPLALLLDDHQALRHAELAGAALARGAAVYIAGRDVVAATAGFDLHRGVVALARRPALADPATLLATARREAAAAGRRCVVAVLEGLNDHENLGALFRNAAAFGVSAVLLDPTCADPLYRRSVRVSLGHVLGVPFGRLGPLPRSLGEVTGAEGLLVAALSPLRNPDRASRAQMPLPLRPWVDSLAPDEPVAVLLGAEGTGLSPVALGAASCQVFIPMAAGVDSLNVATAAAIAFCELATPAR